MSRTCKHDDPEIAPYGTWDSPISASLLSRKSIRLEDVVIDPISEKIYHVEMRPDEKGRNVVVNSETCEDVIGTDFNARTSVHEYGGSCVAIRDGRLFFSNLPDKNVYARDLKDTDSNAVRVTPVNDNWRYANFVIHPVHPHLLISILEDHTHPDAADVATRLVVVNSATQDVTTLAEGADFYSSPVISPDGSHLAFVRWFHPDMPWDGGEIVIVPLSVTAEGIALKSGGGERLVAGQRGRYNAQNPAWVSNDMLFFLTDETGFLNPYTYSLNRGDVSPVLPSPVSEDFGEAPKVLGLSGFAILSEKQVLISTIKDNRSTLYLLDPTSGGYKDLETPYVYISSLRRVSSNRIAFRGTKLDEADTLVEYTLITNSYRVLKTTSASTENLPKGILSVPKPYSFSSSAGALVHCIFYPPANPVYSSSPEEKPPCIIHIHGGPTGRVGMGLSWQTQFFTSRGFVWIDVNYRGSTGYGTQYRKQVNGLWGVVDVDDAIEVAKQTAELGLIDINRVAIRGSSAGGYTTLMAVGIRPTFFAAGTCLYGISNLFSLAENDHKYESHYIDTLFGGTPKEHPELYRERSPITHVDNIKTPLLVMHGTVDRAVPIGQAEEIVRAIEANKGVVKFIQLEGEGHGWRQSANIETALEAELAWYQEKMLDIKQHC